jgi:hypothetical protein
MKRTYNDVPIRSAIRKSVHDLYPRRMNQSVVSCTDLLACQTQLIAVAQLDVPVGSVLSRFLSRDQLS